MKKYLVAYLDFIGFSNFYDLANRELDEDKRKKINEQLQDEYFELMQGLQDSFLEVIAMGEDHKKLSRLINTIEYNFLSDSIIISSACDDAEELPYILGIFISGISHFNKYLVKTYRENILRGCLLHFHPLRGGISYDYGLVTFKHTPPIALGSVWGRAINAEKAACWPRVVIDQNIVNSIPNFSWLTDQVEFGFEDEWAFIDNFTNLIKGFIARKECEFLHDLFIHQGNFLRLWLESSGKWLNEQKKNGSIKCPPEVFKEKYAPWIRYFNDRLKFAREYPSNPCLSELPKELSEEALLKEYLGYIES